jgi:hypothetical protein
VEMLSGHYHGGTGKLYEANLRLCKPGRLLATTANTNVDS